MPANISIFYAVLYGSMLASLKGLEAFPWGGAFKRPGRKGRGGRLLISILLFNCIPFLMYVVGLKWLSTRSCIIAPSGLTVLQMFHVLLPVPLPALSVFAPYRFYYFWIVWRKYKRFGLYYNYPLHGEKEDEYTRCVVEKGI